MESTAIQQKIVEFTQADTFNHALDIVFKDYVKYKLYYLKNENNRYEIKWGMSFDEFEKKTPEIPNGTSYEIEQEYYQWEAVTTEMDYFKNMQHKWM